MTTSFRLSWSTCQHLKQTTRNQYLTTRAIAQTLTKSHLTRAGGQQLITNKTLTFDWYTICFDLIGAFYSDGYRDYSETIRSRNACVNQKLAFYSLSRSELVDRLDDHHHQLGRVKKRISRLKKDSDYDFLEGLHPVAVRNIDNIIDLTD